MTPLPRCLRRLVSILLRSALGLGLLGAALVAGVLLYLRATGARSELSQGEWQRLRARLLERTTEAAPVEAEVTPIESPEPEPVAPPTRLPIEDVDPGTLEQQRREYLERRAKGILELQQFRRTSRMSPDSGGSAAKQATLVNLNPAINTWYLLSIEWGDGRITSHHLVNAHPTRQDITLDPDNPNGLTFLDTAGKRHCDLWSSDGSSPLASADAASTPYLPLCDEQVTVRLRVPGRRTTLEWTTDFLRDNVWKGEQITLFVRQRFFQDAYLETSKVVEDDAGARPGTPSADAPAPARLDPRFDEARIGVGDLGLEVEGAQEEGVLAGKWHPATGQPGVFVSVIRPDLLDPDVFVHHRDVVSRLDDVEREALVYLVAFDLSRLDIGFAVGTEHPRVDWSERIPESTRDPRLPGPDGIGEIDPLVRTGIVPRSLAGRTVATFTGGFKRAHGAFSVSSLAERNFGSHYGFIESGTVLSKLQPGLATFFLLREGTVDMKTWSEADESLLSQISFARQNGLPIVEPDPQSGEPVPGRQVSQWAAGNWSGSQDRKFRAVRGGTALQETRSNRFLIYAYFSSATPSAMARVFEAYQCRYAMLLDMNALEHTYLALYRVREGNLDVQHLVPGMSVLDKTTGGQTLPRFLGFADNRDFFYVVRKGDNGDASP